MSQNDYIPARILYPDTDRFTADDGKRFTTGYGLLYNDQLDAIRVNSTLAKISFGECNPNGALKLTCTGALEIFQAGQADFNILPIPLIVLDGLEGVIKIGPTAYQLTHALGSVTPPNSNNKSDIDLIDTVRADSYSIGLFFSLPFIIYFINFLHRKLTKQLKLKRKTERGSMVLIKMIRMLLNQPNYSPNDFSMRLMISLCLFSTLFILTVYRNIFGSDLTVTDSVESLDRIDQFNQSNRFVVYDQVSITKQIVLKSNDPMSKLFQSRTDSIKSDWGVSDFMKVQTALVKKEAVTLTNLVYHQYFAGGYCFYMLNRKFIEPINRYHVSKETFLPTVTAYVYGYNISSELEKRYDHVLTKYIENGIEQFYGELKPKMAFKEFSGNDDTFYCTQKFEIKEESFPSVVTLKLLRKTVKFCVFLAACSSFFLLVEILCKFTGSKSQVAKDVNWKPDRRYERNRMAFESRWRSDTYQGQRLRNDSRVGIQCSDTRVAGTRVGIGITQHSNEENRIRMQKSTPTLEVELRTWEPVQVTTFNVKPR